MTTQNRCPECEKPLPEASAHELCPACLMAQAMASRTVEAGQEDEALPPPPAPEEIADRFPQFEVVECLGRGGMGVVYKARQKSLDRWVAIKILHHSGRDTEKFAARFEKEARTLGRMSHPNIVTVFDHGEADGLYYIVMEFVDGVNLRDLLRDGKMEPEQALAIVPPICEALEYAHQKEVVHRDIKPENLLLDREGRVKIADFGIASLVGADGERSGTPPYMAPEQEQGIVDRRADIYALGAVLYEMLTGERPAQDLVVPSQRVEVDVRIDDMVLRALAKEPERRYQTAGEFRTVVETIAAPVAAGAADAPAVVAPSDPFDVRRWKMLRFLSQTGVLAVMAAVVGVIFCVKIVPGWENAWSWANRPLGTGEQLLLGISHFCQRIWPLLAPLILLVAVASATLYVIAVRKLRACGGGAGGGGPAGGGEAGRFVTMLANVAVFLAFLSALIPTLFYWLRPFHAEWLTGYTVAVMLELTLVVAVLAIVVGWVSRRIKRGRVAAIYGGISLTIWILFFVAGKLSQFGKRVDERLVGGSATVGAAGRDTGDGGSVVQETLDWESVAPGLQFRIAPGAGELEAGERKAYAEALETGRWDGRLAEGSSGGQQDYRWLPVAGELSNAAGLVTAEHEGKPMVLVSERPAEKMLPGEDRDAWQVRKAFVLANDGFPETYSISYELDDHGAVLFAALTAANVDRNLAIIVDGEVVSAPTIKSALGRRGVIMGLSSRQGATRIMEALRSDGVDTVYEAAAEQAPGDRPPPLNPADGIVANLQSLHLTKEQEEKLRRWVGQRGATASPTALVEFVMSILRDDQQAEFRKLIESGPDPAHAEGGGANGGGVLNRATPKSRAAAMLGLTAPVRVTEADIFPDGGTQVVRLVDATGKEFVACIDGRMDRVSAEKPGLLHIGVRHPGRPGGRKVAYAGPEEAALRVVLLRWAEGQPNWKQVCAMSIHDGHKANRQLWEVGRFLRALDGRLAVAGQQGADKEQDGTE